jgi:hypothetical protein
MDFHSELGTASVPAIAGSARNENPFPNPWLPPDFDRLETRKDTVADGQGGSASNK